MSTYCLFLRKLHLAEPQLIKLVWTECFTHYHSKQSNIITWKKGWDLTSSLPLDPSLKLGSLFRSFKIKSFTSGEKFFGIGGVDLSIRLQHKKIVVHVTWNGNLKPNEVKPKYWQIKGFLTHTNIPEVVLNVSWQTFFFNQTAFGD